ncbi:hypothetical protein [Streptomyces subrutilus]|uniref:Uncharacterized protein n=1 Tax=Streptomyces subrutilus TaxID=36818 RepID=A0A1E5NXU7_9ACTN|nr:hypothetical protein [Streptomyces subrutilus]OEJ21074.1 hypothetical protein BGK67_34845 [Streptomyces subrutilus]
MTAVGPRNGEITTEVLRSFVSGELPLDGWTELVLHCQVDEIGSSEVHPDLVRLKVSLPPTSARRDPEVKVMQGFTDWPRELLLDLGVPLPAEPFPVPPHVRELLTTASPLLASPQVE